jgi:hypothetical protein
VCVDGLGGRGVGRCVFVCICVCTFMCVAYWCGEREKERVRMDRRRKRLKGIQLLYLLFNATYLIYWTCYRDDRKLSDRYRIKGGRSYLI